MLSKIMFLSIVCSILFSSMTFAQDSVSAGTNSTLPPFQLHTLHNEIWAPAKSDGWLQGIADQNKLSGNATDLSSGASVSFLQGRVSTDGESGPLTTMQRLLRPRILTGYTMMRAQSSPLDLFRDLKAQLDRANPKLNAEIAKAKKEMDAQLASHPQDIPFNLDAIKNTENPKMPSAIPVLDPLPVNTKPDPHLQAQIDLARRQMEWQLAHSGHLAYSTPVMPGVGGAGQSIDIDIEARVRMARQDESTNIELAKRQMQAELARAKSGVTPDIRADRQQLDRAKKETAAQIAAAKPAMDAILTNLRVSPNLIMPSTAPGASTQSVDAELSYEKVIAWDKWYARVAKLYEPLLLKAIARHGNPEGANTVSITVSRNHQVEVSLMEADDSAFDLATLEAYRALNGNPVLEFPPGSHRSQVSFLIDNKHNNNAPVSRVSSQTYTGDKEVQGYRWKK